MCTMTIRVVEFLNGGYKIRKILPKNQHTWRKLQNFKNWVNGEVSKSVKKCQNFTFKVNFQCQKLFESLSMFFFHWRISIQEHIFCHWHFLITSLLFEMMPNFWHLPVNPILKIQKFPLILLILRAKIFIIHNVRTHIS